MARTLPKTDGQRRFEGIVAAVGDAILAATPDEIADEHREMRRREDAGMTPDPTGRPITSRAEWLSWRRNDITASRLPALFNSHPYMTREDLAAELRGENRGLRKGPLRRGRILEASVAAAVAEEHPEWTLRKADTYHRVEELRLGATPDYWIGDAGILECKTVIPEIWERWHGHPPLGYTIQVLTNLMVTGRTRGILAVMVLSRSYPVHLFEVLRHLAAEAKIEAAVKEWWRVWPLWMPEAAPAAPIAADLDGGSHLDLSGDNELPALLNERDGLKRTEQRLKEIDAAIKAKIGTARTAWLPGWLLKYPSIHRDAYTVAASDYRRLTITRSEE